MALPSLAETKTYQLCTDEDVILNPDNQFIIVSAKAFSNNVYAVTTGVAGVAVKSNSTSVPAELTLDADDLNLGIFSFVNNGTYKSLLEKNSGKYLGGSSSTTISTDASNSGPNFQLSVSVGNTGEVTIISQGSTTRVFSFQKGTLFKNYAKSNLTTVDYAYPLFYKEVVTGPKDPDYGGFESEYTLEIGEIMQFPAISPKELTYKFTSDDSDIIEIDDVNKTFKALKEGIAVVSFSTDAFEDQFNAGSGEFMIEVTKKSPKVSFSDQIVYGKLNVGVVWQELIIEDPIDADRSTITYTSSDPTIVVVDPVTGQIKPEDIKNAGEVIITATLPAAGDYAEGSDSYKILIIDPEAKIEPDYAVFDFTTENAYGMHTQSGNSAKYEKDFLGENEKFEIEEKDVVTISFDGNYRSWATSSGYELRVNKAASFTVNVPEGYKITQIGMAGSSWTGEYNPGGAVDEVEGTHPDEWGNVGHHWHAGDQVVNTVTYTNGNGSKDNVDKINKIFVMYEAASSDLKSAKLSFTPTVNGIIAGEEATINAVRNPNGREIRYSLSNVENTEDETLYTIEPTEDGKNLKVWVKNPGYYTLEARSDAGDGFRDGFAIMRLNVFNHLDVYVDGVKIEEDVIPTAGDDNKVVTFEVTQPEVLNIYYRIEDKDTPAIDPEEETGDENCEPGYEMYDELIDIAANTNGKLLFYVANYGYKSPIRTIILGEGIVVPAVPELPEFEVVGGTIDDHFINSSDIVTIKFKPVDGIHVYYKTTLKNESLKARDCAHPDGHGDFTKHDGVEEIELNGSHASFSVFACNPETDQHSETVTYTLDVATGISDINAADATEAIYFNLQGVRVENPENGTYIRVAKGKAEKVMK